MKRTLKLLLPDALWRLICAECDRTGEAPSEVCRRALVRLLGG